ncbi:WD-40 repeat-containing protein [Flagelloscypha sp. PMI_526]|nr:WD-40 repeat-containing protein [Flagelloscypha sp. PMI_526]
MVGFDTVLPADSVEFCPHPNADDILLCGTYKLNEPSAAKKRSGLCIVLRTSSSGSLPSVETLQELPLPAIPDIKWCHRSESVPPVAAVADSEGHISLFQWDFEKAALAVVSTLDATDANTLCLSIDWSNRRTPSTELGSLAVSMSDGCIGIFKPTPDGKLHRDAIWNAHDYEPWIAAWDYWDSNRIYSGGDDLSLKVWDTRQPTFQPVLVNRKFEAGVTTIQNHPFVENLIAVGSYDETLRLFDTRMLQRPFLQESVGSAPWRVKWHPSSDRQGDLLVACMRDGYKVIRLADGGASPATGSTFEVTQRFDEHDPEGLCYGVDWSHKKEPGRNDTLIASCSFYDHLLHLWYG